MQKAPLQSILTSKGSVAAGDDNSPDVFVGFEGIESLPDLQHEAVTQSVKDLGSVQLDETDVLFLATLFHHNVVIRNTPCVNQKTTPRKQLRLFNSETLTHTYTKRPSWCGTYLIRTARFVAVVVVDDSCILLQ